MSEHIVHTAILEDSFAICSGLRAISADFKEVIRRHGRFAQLGCITVAGDQFSTRLLTEYKDKWDIHNETLAAKLAFVLGWISHRACDRIMKPIWVEPPMKIGSDVDPTLSPSECSVYHEGFIFNKYYKDADTFRFAIFPEQMEELEGIRMMERERICNFTEQAFAANYMAIQTLPEDGADQEWFENVCMRTQKFYVDMRRYHQSAQNPEPELTERFITGIHWYDEGDGIVRLANDLRWKRPPFTDDYDSVLRDEPASYYGRALRLSIGYITVADEFLKRSDMGLEELKDRLDIGKPGPGGQGV